MKPEHLRKRVESKLDFAARRASDIRQLNAGNFAGADPNERQQLVQEFFFHLGGAVELLAQGINVAQGLDLDPSEVSAGLVKSKLPAGTLQDRLGRLYVNVRKVEPPTDLTSEDGLVYRMWCYRHHVTHRWQKPFALSVGNPSVPQVRYKLDPMHPHAGDSQLSIFEDNDRMLSVVEAGCLEVLELLGL